jgi:hypothetical protein
LDYDKTSDFEDVAGHWHVEPAISRNGHTARSRVYYACNVHMKWAVPSPLLNSINKSALRQATEWVKKASEAHPDLTVPAMYGGKLLPSSSSPLALASAKSDL